MNKTFLILGSLAGGLAVILGAFGAHALKEKLQPDQLQVFETGVRYQMYHAFALILLFLIGGKINSQLFNSAGWFFVTGIILFSGSIYLLACKEILGIDSWKKILGPITPIGGLCLILGWFLLAYGAFKTNVNN